MGLRGQALVDLGTGTGTLARNARRGCVVTGIDPAANMLEQAKQLSAAEGISVDYRGATAEATGLADESADVVSAGQCWHWFDGNAAAKECHRVLRPGGKVVIAHFDWIPLKGNVVEATEQLIQAYNAAWKLGGGSGVILVGRDIWRKTASRTWKSLRTTRFRFIRMRRGADASVPARELARVCHPKK